MAETELQEIAEGNDAREQLDEQVSEIKEKSEIIEEPESREESKVIEETEQKETEEEEEEEEEETKATEEIEGKEEEKSEIEGLFDSAVIEELYEGVQDEVEDEVEEEVVEEVDESVEEEEEILEEVPDNILSEEIIKEGISLLRRTGSGLSYSFIKLDLLNRKLTDVSILGNYIHLRIVNLSNNYLTDLKPFNTLTDLLHLTANKNRIAKIMLDPCPFLQYLSINNNRIKDITEGISHPLVRYIDLSNNKIKKLPPFDGSTFLHLSTLKIEGNNIENIEKFNIPNLKILHLGNNKLTSTEWILELINLEELKLNNNFIEKLQGFHSNMKTLNYIDLKENKIAQYFDLTEMSTLPGLTSIMLIENPIALEDDYRIEVLCVLKNLKLLDEEEFSDDDHVEARTLSRQRRISEIAQVEDNSS